jgi:hypothetical protein
MKKIIFLLMAICGLQHVFAQKLLKIDTTTGKILYKNIVEVDSSGNTYGVIKRWFTENKSVFNRGNNEKAGVGLQAMFGLQKNGSADLDQIYVIDNPLKYESSSEMRMNGIGVIKYTGSNLGCLRLVYIQYDIRVSVKETKYKIEITNLTYTSYNPYNNNQQMQFSGLNNKGPCSSKGSLETLLDCDGCDKPLRDMYTFIHFEMSKIMVDLENYIRLNKSSNDEW